MGIDEWTALNDEIRLLVRAGVPLESRLADSARESSGRAAQALQRLAERLERGEGLADAVREEGDGLPQVYAAVVEAGAAAGRLSSALEVLARSMRRIADLQGELVVAIAYPSLVVLVGYLLFVLSLFTTLPRLLALSDDLGIARQGTVGVVAVLAEHSWWFVASPPLALLAAAVYARPRQNGLFDPGILGRLASVIPGVGRVVADTESAAFAELLSLLAGQGVPLPRALDLAGRASGERRREEEAAALARLVESGASPKAAGEWRRLPPELVLALADAAAASQSGSRPSDAPLAGSLALAARSYGQRARRGADRLKARLPLALSFVLGAGLLAYALLLFGPMRRIWVELPNAPRVHSAPPFSSSTIERLEALR